MNTDNFTTFLQIFPSQILSEVCEKSESFGAFFRLLGIFFKTDAEVTDYREYQMSHLLLSQGKFVFTIFDCDHEFLASDDAIIAREMTRVNACGAYQKHGGHSRQLAPDSG